MMLSLQRHVHDAIVDAVRRQYGLTAVPAFSVEVPPDRGMGDLAVTLAFQLARPLRKAPRAIAQELAASIGSIATVTRAVAAPNGYLNVFLDRPAFLLARLRDQVAPIPAQTDKAVVEHTAINPNKAAHIGHLRNAVLGDTLARALRFLGTPVEVQNYIDDTGVQVADVVVGFQQLQHKTIDDVRAIADRPQPPFDYYCWDLYALLTDWYGADPSKLATREATLHDLEKGGNDTAALGAFIVDRIVRAHLKTMGRLNVSYDLLTYEGDILRLQFWARTFEILKAQGAVFLQTEGKLAGCWVMRIEEGEEAPEADAGESIEPGGESVERGGESIEPIKNAAREKVIVRSNGVVTYVGKDLANQFWKFGLLGKDFRYRAVGTQADGRPLWSTTSTDGDPKAPPFGRALRIYNVIDSRQMYLQALLAQALRALGHAREAENSIHFSYEMVALSHATARELGYDIARGTEGAHKPFVEVSGRKGLGVKIDDLLDLLTEKASAEVATRNPDFTPDERRVVASQIAVAAIRYFMLKYSRGKMIVFDIEEALSFEGETGPYLQYAVVRANNIFHKLRARDGLTDADVARDLDRRPADELTGEPSDLWALVLEAGRLDEIVDQVVRSLEFSVLAKYAFGLAQLFNTFYHHYPLINEEQADRKGWRVAGVAYFRLQLTRALDVMGIQVPVRM